MQRERPLDYVPISTDIDEHRKTKRLARLVTSVVPVHLFVTEMFRRAGKVYPTGEFPGDFDAIDVAEVSAWPGDPEAWLEGLLSSGYLDRTDDGCLRIVGWEDAGGKVIIYREADRRRKREKRAERKINDLGHSVRRTSADIHGNPEAVASGSLSKSKSKSIIVREEKPHTPETQLNIEAVAPAKPARVPAADHPAVAAYLEHKPRCHVMARSAKTKQMIKAREKDGYSPEDLALAVHGLFLDDWEGRAKHDGIKYAIKDADAVEKFKALAEAKGKARSDKGPFSARRFADLAQRIRLPDPTPELRQAVASKFSTWDDFEARVRDCFGAETWVDISKELRIEI